MMPPYTRPQRRPVPREPSAWEKFGGYILGGLGGIGGSIAGAFTGGPAGAVSGALGGFQAGQDIAQGSQEPDPPEPTANELAPPAGMALPEPALSPEEVMQRKRQAEQALLAQLTQNRYGAA
ncbi:MAG: hypothetical protein AMXMBFR64_62890 [Myxococcales bacterium]